MNDLSETPRAFSPVGFVVSLVGIALWSTLFFALGLAAIFLGDVALHGFDHALALTKLITGTRMPGREAVRDALVLTIGCLVYVALVVGILTMARLREGPLWRAAVAWAPGHGGWRFWAFLGLAWAYGVAASLALSQLPSGPRSGFSMPDSQAAVFLSLILIVVLAPIAEELMFRGWIFTGLRRFGFGLALWGSSVLFALAHWGGSFFYSLAILPIGLILGVLRERTGSVLTTSAFHALYNFAMWGLTFLGKV